MKRQDYINWDELFMGIAEKASTRSKDPSTRHGSCIVRNNKVLSVGYNGLPKGFNDDGYYILDHYDIPPSLIPKDGLVFDYWDKENKYPYVVHSEENAIVNAKQDLTGATLYLFSEKGYYPCSLCARMISQSDIVEVVMKTAIKTSTKEYNWDHTKHIFKCGGVSIRIMDTGEVK